MRPLLARIDSAALTHNLGVARTAAGSAHILAVIKANAYGHGLLRAAAAKAGIRAERFAAWRAKLKQEDDDKVARLAVEMNSDASPIHPLRLCREVRDFMDLCQAVEHVIRRNVPGDVCEFGSFKGHSGYLIARLLETGGSDKNVHLFDTFERFPEETAGVDTFWNGRDVGRSPDLRRTS